jgi:hypothetical protein
MAAVTDVDVAVQQRPVLSELIPQLDALAAHKESTMVVEAVRASRVVDGEHRARGRSIQIRAGDMSHNEPGRMAG